MHITNSCLLPHRFCWHFPERHNAFRNLSCLPQRFALLFSSLVTQIVDSARLSKTFLNVSLCLSLSLRLSRSSGTAGRGWSPAPTSTSWAATRPACPTRRPRTTCTSPPTGARCSPWRPASPPWRSSPSGWQPTTWPRGPWTSTTRSGEWQVVSHAKGPTESAAMFRRCCFVHIHKVLCTRVTRRVQRMTSPRGSGRGWVDACKYVYTNIFIFIHGSEQLLFIIKAVFPSWMQKLTELLFNRSTNNDRAAKS